MFNISAMTVSSIADSETNNRTECCDALQGYGIHDSVVHYAVLHVFYFTWKCKSVTTFKLKLAARTSLVTARIARIFVTNTTLPYSFSSSREKLNANVCARNAKPP